MLNNINMELIQAFNPLYAVPIVAVILCAFIVYAFGFKSPVQPSFQGIEEEKKFVKKKKSKETQKSTKLIQNGKANGNVVQKSSAQSPKKKNTSEKPATEKKPSNEKKNAVIEKLSAIDKSGVDKKVSKKAKLQNEKKQQQEKKRESFTQEDEDGWVQFSKKGRKNKKKDETVDGTPTVSNIAPSKPAPVEVKTTEAQVDEKSKKNAEPVSETVVDQKKVVSASKEKSKEKEPAPKEKSAKEVGPVSKEKSDKDVGPAPKEKAKDVAHVSKEKTTKDVGHVSKEKSAKEKGAKEAQVMPAEKPKLPPTAEVTKPDNNKIEKQQTSEPASKEAKVLEESSKSKKKKKKTDAKSDSHSVVNVSTNETEPPAVQVVSEAPKAKPISTTAAVVDLPQDNKKVETNQQNEVKTSNVAFDELAGLYPETKEQKKKKKVRRDH